MKNFKIYLKSLLFLFVCWLAAFVIVMFFPLAYQKMGPIMCLAFGVCSVGATLCIYGDWCIKLGEKAWDRNDTQEDMKTKQHFGFKIGLVPTIVNYIYVVLLYLSKLGVLKFDFYPWYKTLTFYFMPLTYLVAPNEAVNIDGKVMSVNVPAAELSWGAMIMFTLLPLVFLAICWGMYYIGYNHIDVKSKIIYSKK